MSARKLYPQSDVTAAVLERLRSAERRTRGQGFVWCFASVEPLIMPDGGTAPHSKVDAAFSELVASGQVVGPRGGWRLSPAELDASWRETAAEALDRR